MASIPKAKFNSFVQDWNGRKSWAQQAGIPFNDFAATFKYDYQRMTNSQGFGEKMSNTEAFDAMNSLKSGKNPFTTPADSTPSITTNPAGAVRNDIQGIVTGLFHAPQTIYHDFVSAAHGHFGALAQLVPFYSDVTNLFTPRGRDFLLQHPVSDMLDTFGAAHIADLGATAIDHATGGVGAVDLVNKIPDHPVSKLMQSSFTQAAHHVQALANIRDTGSHILGGAGQLTDTKEFVLRPFRAAQDAIKNHLPAPLAPGSLGKENTAFGTNPTGPELFKTLRNLVGTNEMSREEINTAVNYLRYRIIDDTQEPPPVPFDQEEHVSMHDFKANPNVTQSTKNMVQALTDMSGNLQLTNIFDKRGLIPATHPITHAGDFFGENSDWYPFVRNMEKKIQTSNANQTAYATAVQTVYTAIKHLRNDDAGLPAPLKRSPDEVLNTANSMRRAGDYFRANSSQLFSGEGSASTFSKSIQRIFGPDSRYHSIINNVGSLKNVKDSGQLLKDIRSVEASLRRLRIPADDPVKQWLVNSLSDTKQTISSLQTQRDIGPLRDKYEASKKAVEKDHKKIDLKWNQNKARYTPLVQREIRAQVLERLNRFDRNQTIERKNGVVIEPDRIANAYEQALNGDYNHPDVKAIIGVGEFKRITDDAYLLVSDMENAGVSPIFITGINREEEAKIMAGNYNSITDISKFKHRSIEHSRAPVLTDTIYNPIFGIIKEAAGMYHQSLVEHLLTEFVPNVTVTTEQLLTTARSDAKYADIPQSEDAILAYATARHWRRFNPHNPFGGTFEKHVSDPESMWIQDYNLKILKGSLSEMDRSLSKAWDKGMNVYRFGVLYASPRFAAHITLGGAFMTLLQLEHPIVTPLKYMRQAWAMGKDEHNYATFVSHGISEQGAHGDLKSSYDLYMKDPRNAIASKPLETHNWLVGRKLAQFYHDARESRLGVKTGSTLESYKELLEHVSNAYRALALIEGEEHALADPSVITPEIHAMAKRWNTTPEKYYGATLARKVLADMQVVSPMERAILMRYVVPFWGWSRHIGRYVTTYPADHPLRASIIQSISNQAIGGDSNLPNYLFRLLFLGQPNAQGNVTVLDDRQWNPFRDVANYMTWGGIMSQLNPVLQAITASAWGVNSATGGPDLFPELTFDAFYGSDTAAPTGGNVFVDLVKQVSPQIDTLLAATKATSSLREQAKSNPGTLGYLIAQSVGFPWIPHTLNTKHIQIKGTVDQASLASQAVQKALVENSMAPLKGYSGLLPFDGYNVDKNFISELINQALAYNKSTHLDIPATDLTALPYASPYYPETLLGPKSEGQGK